MDADPRVITAGDPAWRHYRLKGTQSTFTTTHGVPTAMGATVTEGGFVNSASCVTCHSQASWSATLSPAGQGDDPSWDDVTTGPGAGGSVGATWRLNLTGFGQVAMGSPELAWFFAPGTDAPFTSVQVDFVWGILAAQPQVDGEGHPRPPYLSPRLVPSAP